MSLDIKNIGNEFLAVGKELVTGKTYTNFKKLDKNIKVDVIAKTALVAFAAGILGSLLVSSFAFTALVSGVFALGYFTRASQYDEAAKVKDFFSDILDAIKSKKA